MIALRAEVRKHFSSVPVLIVAASISALLRQDCSRSIDHRLT
jgi:hypothetical protein